MRGWGMILTVLGIAAMFGGYVYDASVPAADGFGAIINMGKSAEKQMIFSLGAVLFLAGVVLFGCDGIATAVREGPKVPPARPTVDQPSYTVGPGAGA